MTARKPKSEHKQRGRPSFKFTDEQITDLEKVAGLHATRTEAAGWFGIDLRTFNKQLMEDTRAAEAWNNGVNKGKISLRRLQFQLAERSAAMAIFLGKQILGQRDVYTNEHLGANGEPIRDDTVNLKVYTDDQLKQLERILTDVADGAASPNGTGRKESGRVH